MVDAKIVPVDRGKEMDLEMNELLSIFTAGVKKAKSSRHRV
jgi:hypothetical protein